MNCLFCYDYGTYLKGRFGKWERVRCWRNCDNPVRLPLGRVRINSCGEHTVITEDETCDA